MKMDAIQMVLENYNYSNVQAHVIIYAWNVHKSIFV